MRLLCAPARGPVRAPCPYLQRRAKVVRAKLAPERTPDTSTTTTATKIEEIMRCLTTDPPGIELPQLPVPDLTWGGVMPQHNHSNSNPQGVALTCIPGLVELFNNSLFEWAGFRSRYQNGFSLCVAWSVVLAGARGCSITTIVSHSPEDHRPGYAQ